MTVVLDYIQWLGDSGVKFNTITSHISALSQCLPLYDGVTIGNHPWVSQWVKGLLLSHPPGRLVYPSWELGLVLTALTEAPYEPLGKACLEALTFKTAFLISVISARRVSELQALSRDPAYLTLNPLSAILRVNPAFVPKTVTEISLQSEIEIQAFLPFPSSPAERLMALNCPIRALRVYLQCMQLMCKSSCLFVGFSKRRFGQEASKAMLSGWLHKVITNAYTHMGRDFPAKSNPHTIRKVSYQRLTSHWKGS